MVRARLHGHAAEVVGQLHRLAAEGGASAHGIGESIPFADVGNQVIARGVGRRQHRYIRAGDVDRFVVCDCGLCDI